MFNYNMACTFAEMNDVDKHFLFAAGLPNKQNMIR